MESWDQEIMDGAGESQMMLCFRSSERWERKGKTKMIMREVGEGQDMLDRATWPARYNLFGRNGRSVTAQRCPWKERGEIDIRGEGKGKKWGRKS